MSKQFLRSGTATGALVREAEHKEANETVYWIKLLFQSDYIDKKTFTDISEGSSELLRLLVVIVKSMKNKKEVNN